MPARTSNAQRQIPNGKQDTPLLDTTKLVQGVFARMEESQAGTVTGTGALITVNLDFDPAEVELIKPAGTGAPVVMKKHPGQATDSTLKVIAAGTQTIVAAGVTLGAQGAKSFTIGTDAAINESGQPILWIARGYSGAGPVGAL